MFAVRVKSLRRCKKYKLIGYILAPFGAVEYQTVYISLRGLFDYIKLWTFCGYTLSGPSACNKFQRSSGADCWAAMASALKYILEIIEASWASGFFSVRQMSENL